MASDGLADRTAWQKTLSLYLESFLKGGNMRLKYVSWAILVISSLLTFTAPSQEVRATIPGTHEVQVTAKKYEFNPAMITVRKGEHVKLVITATDRDHGFKLDAFKINQHLKKGEPTTVEFDPKKAGEFPFQCSVICGMGHHHMKGTLVVEE